MDGGVFLEESLVWSISSSESLDGHDSVEENLEKAFSAWKSWLVESLREITSKSGGGSSSKDDKGNLTLGDGLESLSPELFSVIDKTPVFDLVNLRGLLLSHPVEEMLELVVDSLSDWSAFGSLNSLRVIGLLFLLFGLYLLGRLGLLGLGLVLGFLFDADFLALLRLVLLDTLLLFNLGVDSLSLLLFSAFLDILLLLLPFFLVFIPLLS